MNAWDEFKRDMVRFLGWVVRLFGSTLVLIAVALATKNWLPPWMKDSVQAVGLLVWFGYMVWLLWNGGLRESVQRLRDTFSRPD